MGAGGGISGRSGKGSAVSTPRQNTSGYGGYGTPSRRSVQPQMTRAVPPQMGRGGKGGFSYQPMPSPYLRQPPQQGAIPQFRSQPPMQQPRFPQPRFPQQSPYMGGLGSMGGMGIPYFNRAMMEQRFGGLTQPGYSEGNTPGYVTGQMPGMRQTGDVPLQPPPMPDPRLDPGRQPRDNPFIDFNEGYDNWLDFYDRQKNPLQGEAPPGSGGSGIPPQNLTDPDAPTYTDTDVASALKYASGINSNPTPEILARYDVNGDGQINISDVTGIKDRMGNQLEQRAEQAQQVSPSTQQQLQQQALGQQAMNPYMRQQMMNQFRLPGQFGMMNPYMQQRPSMGSDPRLEVLRRLLVGDGPPVERDLLGNPVLPGVGKYPIDGRDLIGNPAADPLPDTTPTPKPKPKPNPIIDDPFADR